MERSMIEKDINSALSPFESYLLRLQSLVLWEKPKESSLFALFVLAIYVFGMCMPPLRLIGYVGLIITGLSFVCGHLWPTIRVPMEREEKSLNEWVCVHPATYSVPEIAHHIANVLATLVHFVDWLVELRNQAKWKFTLLMCTSLLFSAFIGTLVSGYTILSLTVLNVMSWPAIRYHKLDEQLYAYLQPYVKHTQKRLNIHSWVVKSKKTKKKRSVSASVTKGVDSSSDSDDDLAGFIPSQSASASMFLSSPDDNDASDNDDDTGSPTLLTPQPPSSRASSAKFTDTEDEAFATGLKLPEYDESYTTDDMLDGGSTTNQELNNMELEVDLGAAIDSAVTPTNEVIQFVTTHFNVSSSSSESDGGLDKGLDFNASADELADDVANESKGLPNVNVETQSYGGGSPGSEALGYVMSSAWSGISKLTETVKSSLGSPTAATAKPLPSADEATAALVHTTSEEEGDGSFEMIGDGGENHSPTVPATEE